MNSKILKIETIKLNVAKTKPPVLTIEASGTVPSGGWKKGLLVPYIYVKEPADGIYEFDFIADAPTGPATDQIAKIAATPFEWADYPESLKGVKIYASENYKVSKLERASKESLDADNFQLLERVSSDQLARLRASNDRCFISNAYIWEDVLHITVNYSGGCQAHEFRLVWDGTKNNSMPPQYPLLLWHDSKGDNCEAFVTMQLQFRLIDLPQDGLLLLSGTGEEIEIEY